MKNLKCSPGPFKLDDDPHSLNIMAADGYSMAGTAVCDEREGGRPEEDMANAILLAASWDMYKALVIFRDSVTSGPVTMYAGSDIKAIVQVMNAVTFAIAKAEGR